MAEIVYALCAVTSLVCAALLVTSWHRTRARILFWSAICFVGFTINNVLLFVDLVIVPDVDLSIVRAATALASVSALVIGLVWSAR